MGRWTLPPLRAGKRREQKRARKQPAAKKEIRFTHGLIMPVNNSNSQLFDGPTLPHLARYS
jgi:hypothetical protein